MMMMMTLESVLQWYLLHSVQVRALPLHNFPETREIRKSNEWSLKLRRSCSVLTVLWYLMCISHGGASVTTTCCWCCWLDTALRSCCSCLTVPLCTVHTAVVLLQCCCDQGSPHPALSVHLCTPWSLKTCQDPDWRLFWRQQRTSKTEKQEYQHYYFTISWNILEIFPKRWCLQRSYRTFKEYQ